MRKNTQGLLSYRMTESFKQKNIHDLFLETYDTHAAGILKHVLIRVSNREVAQDITSETFTKTWEYITKGNTIQNLKGFLYTVADHLVVDYYQQKTRFPSSLDDLTETSSEPHEHTLLEHTDTKINMDRMRAYVRELPQEYQKIILFRFINEFSIAEIRAITGKSSTNIYVSIHRALRILKNKMKHDQYEPLI